MFKRIRWTGPESFLPNQGTVVAGQELKLLERRADSYIAQGLAEAIDLEEPAPTEIERTLTDSMDVDDN